MKKTLTLVLLFIGLIINAQENSINKITFEGLKRTKETFLKRLIRTKEGAVLDTLKIIGDVERLKRLPGIAIANYAFAETPSGTDLTYTIEENFTLISGLRIATANDGSSAYRISAFEFNLFGNNQLLGAFYEKNVFNSNGAFWEHAFLFSDKLVIDLNYQDVTTQEPVFFEEGDKNYRFNSRNLESDLLFSFDFNNEAEMGAILVKESYSFEGNDPPPPNRPLNLNADKLIYRAAYRHVDLDIE
ncbi:POTRA domain-containing protein [Maribacter sp. 4U21]|uniref:POTRA domain-containing protein n=1 Tax=Maribacter sp. 4U21 TaxID=1889779 RepID=UPI000C14A1E1|nr:POTRA domain-containing protein [Maribacter sp. 4U21]